MVARDLRKRVKQRRERVVRRSTAPTNNVNDHPYLPLYFGDVLRQTVYWSGEARALYLLLLAVTWNSGPLPRDPEEIARAVQYPPDLFRRLWDGKVGKQFTETPHGFVNDELEERRGYVARLSDARSAAGRASGKARRAKRRLAGSSNKRTNTTTTNREQSREQTREQPSEQISEQTHEQNSKQLLAVLYEPQTNPNPNQSRSEPEELRPPPASVADSPSDHHPPLEPAVSHAKPADPPPATATANTAGKQRRKRFPADHPTEQLREWARTNTPGVDFNAELATLRDHEFRDAHSDWDAVVRNWLRRAAKAAPRGANGTREHVTRFEQHKRRLYGDA